jgi:two-component system OmpR family response regulator
MMSVFGQVGYMKQLLLIDDDEKLAEPLQEYFARFDLCLSSETHPLKGIERIKQEPFELVVLDVMLPEIDGFETCRRIRQFSDIPILMLTARGDVMDRVVGLELGADDYLPKPFEPRELVVRIQNILKRSREGSHQELYKFGDLKIDLSKKLVQKNDQVIDITSTEFGLLEILIRDQNKVFSRDDIMHALNGIDADIYSRAIDVLVSRLRHKLQRPELIRTVRGSGYQFVSR